MPSFKLTAKQEEAQALLGSNRQHIMLVGGSRSGKTFLLTRAITARAIKAPGSRHAILRFRSNHVKTSILYDTFPKVMRTCWPDQKYETNKADLFFRIGESEIWLGGLDDNERTEKILGQEYSTIFLNECSQIPFASRNIAVTRLAQKCNQTFKDAAGRTLTDTLVPKLYYDENPPDRGHWTYRLFVKGVDPESGQNLSNVGNYGMLYMNPDDNLENLPDGYIDTLRGLPERLQRRFLRGQFREASPDALFPDEVLDLWRVTDLTDLPDMQRIVIAVDPSGSDDTDNAENDEIGIIVAGLGTDGNGYILEDLTVKAGPGTWGKVATNAFDRLMADLIVAEVNFGGAMVKMVIQTARPRTPFKAVVASRGKVVRAEPVSSLAESGRLRLAGRFVRLEEELSGMTTHGYVGQNSPNRADGMVWAVSELFPNMISERKKRAPAPTYEPIGTPEGWMG
jgi:phage terminase large subunit-like protein